MNEMFKAVAGKANNGSIDLLAGLTREAIKSGKRTVILSIPVELLDVDLRYQTDFRTKRDLNYLVKNWNEDKLQPIIGVPHYEEGKIYIVDGYGRWIASQMVDRNKYNELEVMLLMKAPQETEARLEYEAEMYAFQNKNVALMKPVQKHGAMLITHDAKATMLEKMKKKYGFEYPNGLGKRSAGTLGSYTSVYNICSIDEGKCADYVFDICHRARLDAKYGGYSKYILYAIKDIYKYFPSRRGQCSESIVSYFIGIMPQLFKENAMTEYPYLSTELACAMYLEDVVVCDITGLSHVRKPDRENHKLVMVS